MFNLHPILSNNFYKLLKTIYPASNDIHEAPNMALESHRLAAAWQEALESVMCFSYGQSCTTNEDGDDEPSLLYLLLDCEQITNNTYTATVKTLSRDLVVNMLSDPFVIKFTYHGDMTKIENYGKAYIPIMMDDVEVLK